MSKDIYFVNRIKSTLGKGTKNVLFMLRMIIERNLEK